MSSNDGLIAQLETMADEGAMIHCLSWIVIQGALRKAASAIKNAAPQVPASAGESDPAPATPAVAALDKDYGELVRRLRSRSWDDRQHRELRAKAAFAIEELLALANSSRLPSTGKQNV